MAHQLKYYKEIDSHGHLWRVEILQETEDVLTPMEIGPVLQSLKLVLQGDQADVDTPIVKTSLEMTFVDAPDFDTERKCGYWEEFYTSSSTEYMVCLYKDGEKEWSGYVTPDSFAEDLRYRGSVSIIARDNLGTLKDITCDARLFANIDGKVALTYVISSAVHISGCALDFSISDTFPASNASGGRDNNSGKLLQQYADASIFDDINWYDALDKVLYSIGAVLRYVGKNRIVVMPLRDIPLCGNTNWWDVDEREVRFLSYGHRELMPGIKDITETQEYTVEMGESSAVHFDTYTSAPTDTPLQVYGLRLLNPDASVSQDYTASVPVFAYSNPTQLSSTKVSPLLNVSAYERVGGEDSEEFGAWEDTAIIYYAFGAVNDTPVVIAKKSYAAATRAKISFKVGKPVSLTSDGTKVMNTPILEFVGGDDSPRIYYRVSYKATDGTTMYLYNNSWGNTSEALSRYVYGIISIDKPEAQEITIDVPGTPGEGSIQLEILAIRFELSNKAEIALRRAAKGVYVRISDIVIALNVDDIEGKILNRLNLTTVNSDKYAVRLTRDPELSVNITDSVLVAYVRNALLFEMPRSYKGVGDWSWPGKSAQGEGISLTRLIHQQLLAYYAKPNNLLTGELYGDDLALNGIWVWNDTPHMLISGTHNILTGRIEGATLREYKRYEHIWETWADKDEITQDYDGGLALMNVHTLNNKELTKDDIKGLPSWATIISIKPRPSGESIVAIRFMENASGEDRSAVITIDKTARVKLTQRAAGDYGIDYGKDYS